LGIAVQDITPDLARALGLDALTGAIVAAVEPGSPAEAAGLISGDIVLRIDDRDVTSAGDLRNRIGLIPAGTTVALTVRREGQTLQLRATIADAS
jgi:S1-C subfamily serine protease